MEYLTFPVCILRNSIVDIKEALNMAMEYCLFSTSIEIIGSEDQKIQASRVKLGIKFGNIKKSFINGKKIYDSIPINSPKTSLRREMIFDFYNNYKTEFELITFLTFASIRSILQKQAYVKLTNNYLIGRMSGNNKINEPINETIIKYSCRYQLDKIKTELQLNWGLKLYANHTRGFYVSFKMPLQDLIKQAEIKRNKYKVKELQRHKKEALNRALNCIKNETYSQHL